MLPGRTKVFNVDNGKRYPKICLPSKHLFHVNLQSKKPGRHQLNILYGTINVPGSPFYPYFTDKQCLEKLKVFGPGLESSHLHNFESYFTVDTSEAGVGKLRVQVRGPKGLSVISNWQYCIVYRFQKLSG